ncbi:SPX domain-containing protein [Mycena crocata]|nr:SPX domain-containing protein [Mycena crocata]
MKFARYLEDTQTPEWHKAYINYRLLKKRITAIRRGNGDRSALESPLTTHQNENRGAASQASVVRSMDAPNSLHPTISSTSSQHPLGIETPNASMPALVPPNPSVAEQSERREPFYRSQTLPAQTSVHSRRSDPGRAPSFSRLFSSGNSRGTTRRFTVGPKPHPYSELPLRDLLPLLSPPELAFFSTLDGELDKIESFYVSRENDMRIHTKLLEHQLEELAEHRKLFNAAYPSGAWTSALNTAALLKLKAKLLNEEHTVGAAGSAAKNKGKAAMDRVTGKLAEARASSKNAREQGQNYETDHGMIRLAPDDYYDAKHALKKAVLEHYRGLEMLHNYRILNLTGIRKALKKFQKVTKIAAQNAYMTEKVDKMAFASDTNVRSMMDEMEEIYATRFVNGDKKKALTRLRAGPQHKSHHTSTFWSGLFIGLSVPALVSGIYNSRKTRNSVKSALAYRRSRLSKEYPGCDSRLGCPFAHIQHIFHPRPFLAPGRSKHPRLGTLEDKLCVHLRI